MYTPILKNRGCEINALKKLVKHGCLSERIRPFIKLVEVDKTAGAQSLGKNPALLNNLLSECGAFIDYYRCDLGKFKQLNAKKIGEIQNMSSFPDVYLSSMIDLAQFPSFIPVFSICAETPNPSPFDLEAAIKAIRDKHSGKPVGVSLDHRGVDYEKLICSILTSQDYFFYNIGEQPLAAKARELKKIAALPLCATKIILNSPRKRDMKNKDYPTHGYTNAIDCSARDFYASYGFDGFGDFAGLRDDLQKNVRIPGDPRGCALILLYDYDRNRFMSYMNPDSTQAMKGLHPLIMHVEKDEPLLNPDSNCIVYAELARNRKKNPNYRGGYSTWTTFNATRYIQQMSLHLP